MLLFHCDDALAKWAGDQLGMEMIGPYACIGVARQGQIVAVALYNNFRLPNIEVTFVTTTPRWASRSTIGAILRYPFIQLGCSRVTAITEATNQPARAFLCRLGFKQEGCHPDYFPSGEAISYGMVRSDAQPWIAEEHDANSHSSRSRP